MPELRDVDPFDDEFLARRSCRPGALVATTRIALELAR